MIWKHLIDAAKNNPGIYLYTDVDDDYTRRMAWGFAQPVVLPRTAWNILHTCSEMRHMAIADPDLELDYKRACIKAHAEDEDRREILHVPLRQCHPKIDVINIGHDDCQLESFNDGIERQSRQLDRSNQERILKGDPGYSSLVDVSPFWGNISHIALHHHSILREWRRVQTLLASVGVLPNLKKISVVFGPTWQRPFCKPCLEFYEEPDDDDPHGIKLEEEWRIWGLTNTEPPLRLAPIDSNVVRGGRRIHIWNELHFQLEVELNSHPPVDSEDPRYNWESFPDPAWLEVDLDFVKMVQ